MFQSQTGCPRQPGEAGSSGQSIESDEALHFANKSLKVLTSRLRWSAHHPGGSDFVLPERPVNCYESFHCFIIASDRSADKSGE